MEHSERAKNISTETAKVRNVSKLRGNARADRTRRRKSNNYVYSAVFSLARFGRKLIENRLQNVIYNYFGALKCGFGAKSNPNP